VSGPEFSSGADEPEFNPEALEGIDAATNDFATALNDVDSALERVMNWPDQNHDYLAHAATAMDLGGILDIEAGLKEIIGDPTNGIVRAPDEISEGERLMAINAEVDRYLTPERLTERLAEIKRKAADLQRPPEETE
jgi:hypothetical protein